MDTTIFMVDLNLEPNFIIPEEGKYLVKTISEIDSPVGGKFTRSHYLQVNASSHFDKKKNKHINHFECNNQKVVMVSSQPLKF